MNDENIIFNVGEKFAIISLKGIDIADNMPAQLTLPNNYFASTKLPIQLDKHWKEWLGTILTKKIEKSRLHIGTKLNPNTPELLNNGNKILQNRVNYLYHSLFLTDFMHIHDKPITLTGVILETESYVNSVENYQKPSFITGNPPQPEIDRTFLKKAATIAGNIECLFDNKTDYKRIKRVLEVFLSGIHASFPDVRLHQFVRCIEGFIIPLKGSSKKKFKSQTELFVGTRNHNLMDELYELRSKAEHMHDVMEYFEGTNQKANLLRFYQRVFVAEGIARYCIAQFLSKPALWDLFKNDSTIADFWNPENTKRQEIWGKEIDIIDLLKRFDPSYVVNNLIDK